MWLKVLKVHNAIPLRLTLVMMKGPCVGSAILGWLWRSSASRMIRTWSPGVYSFGRRDWFSFLFDVDNCFCLSAWMLSQLMVTAWWKIMSWWKAKWQGECFMLGLMVVLTAHATASRACCMSWNQSVPEKVIILNISPMVRWTHSMTPLLRGWHTVVGTGLMP